MKRRLTFEQREGVAPLPRQLQLKEISQEMRAVLWSSVYESMKRNVSNYWFYGGWEIVLRKRHVLLEHRPADEFDPTAATLVHELKEIFMHGSYAKVFGLLEWILQQQETPPDLWLKIEEALEYSHAAYRLIDGDMIVPIGSEQEIETLRHALADTDHDPFVGARTHLKNAAKLLSEGQAAQSIRESVTAVEAVARVLDETATTLAPALKALAKVGTLHPALQSGFEKLYGFASDEQGIRHALLDSDKAKVDESDALYMLGACAAFVSYLIRKAGNLR